jgi:hypothetical protein
MRWLAICSAAFAATVLIVTAAGAAGRDPALTKESKEHLDKLREHGFREVRERQAEQARDAKQTSAPKTPAGPSLQDLKRKENLAIQKGYRRAALQFVVRGAVEASHRILSRKDTSLKDVIELILTHEDRQREGREAETKAMLEVFDELEKERQLYGTESIRGYDPDPEVLHARGTYQWCVNNLPSDIKREGINRQLAAVERCFKKIHRPLGNQAKAEPVNVPPKGPVTPERYNAEREKSIRDTAMEAAVTALLMDDGESAYKQVKAWMGELAFSPEKEDAEIGKIMREARARAEAEKKKLIPLR